MYLKNINKYSVALLTVLGFGLASCSDESALPGDAENAVVVKAMMTEGPDAGSGQATFTAGDKVALLANGTSYTYTLSADGSMTPDGNSLVWEGNDFTVRAWTPVVNQAVSIADQTSAAKMSACDFLLAETKASSRYVFLIFNHQMTRMTWDIRHIDASYSEQQVNNAEIEFLGYGSVSFSNGEVTASGSPDSRIAPLESGNGYSRRGDAIMAPADMWSKPLIRITIGGDEYIYTPDRANASDAASAAGDLTAGKWQKYHISITRKTLSVEMESTDVEWGDNREFGNDEIADAKLVAEIASDVTDKPGYTVTGLSNGYINDRTKGFTVSYTENGLGGLTWTGTCKVTRTESAGSGNASVQTYTFTDVKTDISVSYLQGVDEGDYVYDNGTWGKEANRDGCKTIGRVFRVGRDSRDDSSYDLCKIRGYVVPLAFANTSEMQWFSNQANSTFIQALADIPVSADPAVRESYYGGYRLTGLLNTALAPYSAEWAEQAPFWYAFKNIDMAAPALSSGWYIPTYAQLKDVCASGLYDRFSGVYWSSQVYPGTGNTAVGGVEEGPKTTLWAIRCGADQAVGYGWVIDRAKLLTILTF